mmetsp:Transcript_5882/g.11491  ORF Transcript_5882/g.11491 Transcript_5882/m.11491 type:complete len:337 (-) Transcript_5882:635-1645(-)
MSLLTIVGLEHTGHHLWEPLLEKTFGKSEMANLYWYLSLISRQPINETLLAQKLHEDTLVSDPSGKELHRRMQEAHHSTGAGGSRSPRGRRFDPDHLKAAAHVASLVPSHTASPSTTHMVTQMASRTPSHPLSHGSAIAAAPSIPRGINSFGNTTSSSRPGTALTLHSNPYGKHQAAPGRTLLFNMCSYPCDVVGDPQLGVLAAATILARLNLKILVLERSPVETLYRFTPQRVATMLRSCENMESQLKQLETRNFQMLHVDYAHTLEAAPHMSRFLQTNVTRALVTSYHVSNRSATARASLEAAGLHRTQSWHAYVACTNRIHKETSHMKEDLHM